MEGEAEVEKLVPDYFGVSASQSHTIALGRRSNITPRLVPIFRALHPTQLPIRTPRRPANLVPGLPQNQPPHARLLVPARRVHPLAGRPTDFNRTSVGAYRVLAMQLYLLHDLRVYGRYEESTERHVREKSPAKAISAYR